MNALQTILDRGRQQLLRRALVTGAVRGLCLSSAVVVPLAGGTFLGQRLAGLDPLASTQLWSTLLASATTVILGGALLAWVAVQGAAARWPRLWDRANRWQDLVETVVDLHTRSNASPWQPALLEQAEHLELPAPAEVAGLLPWRVRGSLQVSALALVLAVIAAVAPIPDLRAGVSIETRETVADRWRERVERTRTQLARADDPAAMAVRTALDDVLADWKPGTLPADGTRDALARALAAAQRWQTAERAAATRRHRAAALLADHEPTRPLARWLTGGELPDRVPERLTPVTRQAVDDAARLLEDRLPDAAEWLTRVASADRGDAPRLDPADGDWRIASSVVVELSRLAVAVDAGFSDPTSAGGGSDPATGESTDEFDPETDATTEPAPDPDAIVTVEGGLGLGHGERLDAAVFRPAHLEGQPEWRQLLERPAIEPYWMPAVVRYRAELDARLEDTEERRRGGNTEPR